ncbi:MAG: methanogenesis marker 17 protein [Methanomassiliicoccales archaeon]|nr:methanogenesis marker 17 protein [Methanomassiliicoccales archaeon]
MNIVVEGSEEYGTEVYAELFERILIDLGLTNRVEGAKLLIYPEKHLFIVSVRMRQARLTVMVPEVADLSEKDGGTFMAIRNESYAPALLALLWKLFGRERIEQLSRLEILAHGIPPSRLEDLALNPGEELRKDVLDAIWRLLPEGFKVRHNLFAEGVMTIISTEHEMQEEFMAMGRQLHQDMVNGLDLEAGARNGGDGEEEEDV